MFLEIKDFLNPAEVARLQELSLKVQFVDGRISNPHNQAKNNLQVSETDPLYAESSRIVAAAYARSAPFRDFAFPRHVAPPLLARYEVGMTYGAHADVSHMRFGTEVHRSMHEAEESQLAQFVVGSDWFAAEVLATAPASDAM